MRAQAEMARPEENCCSIHFRFCHWNTNEQKPDYIFVPKNSFKQCLSAFHSLKPSAFKSTNMLSCVSCGLFTGSFSTPLLLLFISASSPRSSQSKYMISTKYLYFAQHIFFILLNSCTGKWKSGIKYKNSKQNNGKRRARGTKKRSVLALRLEH